MVESDSSSSDDDSGEEQKECRPSPYEEAVTLAQISSPVSLKDFKLLRVLGKGSFGTVLLVRKIDTGRVYAMKVIPKKKLRNKTQVQRTLTERAILVSSVVRAGQNMSPQHRQDALRLSELQETPLLSRLLSGWRALLSLTKEKTTSLPHGQVLCREYRARPRTPPLLQHRLQRVRPLLIQLEARECAHRSRRICDLN